MTAELSVETAPRPETRVRSARPHRLGFWLLAVLAASGCAEEEKTAASVSEPPVLQVVHPQLRVISRVIGQPSFVQSYERTSIYPKLNAFIEKWNVDIGDKVQEGTGVGGSYEELPTSPRHGLIRRAGANRHAPGRRDRAPRAAPSNPARPAESLSSGPPLPVDKSLDPVMSERPTPSSYR
jgi:hypothetical protein